MPHEGLQEFLECFSRYEFDRLCGLDLDLCACLWIDARARLFAEAVRLDKAVEIDGYADRQDLRLSLLKLARKAGVRISLGTDAHHPEQLAYMELGGGKDSGQKSRNLAGDGRQLSE